jgi:hypothetical protein
VLVNETSGPTVNNDLIQFNQSIGTVLNVYGQDPYGFTTSATVGVAGVFLVSYNVLKKSGSDVRMSLWVNGALKTYSTVALYDDMSGYNELVIRLNQGDKVGIHITSSGDATLQSGNSATLTLFKIA